MKQLVVSLILTPLVYYLLSIMALANDNTYLLGTNYSTHSSSSHAEYTNNNSNNPSSSSSSFIPYIATQ